MANERKDLFMSSNPDGDEPIRDNHDDADYDPEPFMIDSTADDDFHITLDDGMPKLDGGDGDKYWYVVHCYSGYENKVYRAILQRIETMGMKDRIFDVLIPTEEEIEVKDGKRRTVERRVFPGYILVQMKMDEDSWYVVRNTPGVTGFVGMGNDPTPLRPEEVSKIMNRMEAEEPVYKVDFKVGEKVRITGGPFNDFIGSVAGIDVDKQKVRVMVDFFGRETPVELDFLEVEKV
jgi:transcriptional antiterminator NusG